jgi:hypothetical protein
MSMTMIRLWTSTCVAASPTPGAVHGLGQVTDELPDLRRNGSDRRGNLVQTRVRIRECSAEHQ